jgi:hypothetical protein
MRPLKSCASIPLRGTTRKNPHQNEGGFLFRTTQSGTGCQVTAREEVLGCAEPKEHASMIPRSIEAGSARTFRFTLPAASGLLARDGLKLS